LSVQLVSKIANLGYVVLILVIHPTLFHLILGLFPLNQIARVGVNERIILKLFGREIIFEVFQSMRSRYLNVTDGQTDTVRQTTCNLTISALFVASCGKNTQFGISLLFSDLGVHVLNKK